MTNRQPAYRKEPTSDPRSADPLHATTGAFGKGTPLVFAAIGALLALTACGGSVQADAGRGANRVPVDPGTQVHASGGNEPALLATSRKRSDGRHWTEASAPGAKHGPGRLDRQHRDRGAKTCVPGRRIRRRHTSGKLSTIFKKRPTTSGERRTLGGVSERSY